MYYFNKTAKKYIKKMKFRLFYTLREKYDELDGSGPIYDTEPDRIIDTAKLRTEDCDNKQFILLYVENIFFTESIDLYYSILKQELNYDMKSFPSQLTVNSYVRPLSKILKKYNKKEPFRKEFYKAIVLTQYESEEMHGEQENNEFIKSFIIALEQTGAPDIYVNLYLDAILLNVANSEMVLWVINKLLQRITKGILLSEQLDIFMSYQRFENIDLLESECEKTFEIPYQIFKDLYINIE